LRGFGQFGGERGFEAARAGGEEFERHEGGRDAARKALLYAGCCSGPRGVMRAVM
jgi:hypothetical protein